MSSFKPTSSLPSGEGQPPWTPSGNTERISLVRGKRIVVIDEIGKMEIASPRFCALVLEVLDSPLVVVAAVMQKWHPFADGLKRRRDVELVEAEKIRARLATGQVPACLLAEEKTARGAGWKGTGSAFQT